ncbi:DEAD/DEAH box helicase [Amnibacterium sp. CER49]|uniref:DEAD/DEAH box helicase n=1 Tax=Amnibacterium sp. CER49 TaxID=3039161 RepID=UPI002446E368|nr:DEAD/DEAH box helicase [Amnibacterium sp. CER49]MDH2444530.1 DEAD/DEAH box helicase [Amnibacterium sp. CER49]
MNKDELRALRTRIDELESWSQRAQGLESDRKRVAGAAEAASAAVRSRVGVVALGSGRTYSFLPLSPDEAPLLGALAQRAALTALTEAEAIGVSEFVSSVPEATRQAKALFGLRRVFSSYESRDANERAAEFLTVFHAWATAADVPSLFDRIRASLAPLPPVASSEALAEWVGLKPLLQQLGIPTLMSTGSLAALPAAIRAIEGAVSREQVVRQRAVEAGVALRRAETDRVIAEMPIDRLKDATRERIRVAPLTAVGMKTVRDVFIHSARIGSLPGVGTVTAQRIRGAARTLWQSTYDEMPVRIDVNKPSEATQGLVRALADWDGSRRTRNAATDIARAEALVPLVKPLTEGATHLVLICPTIDGEGDLLQAVDAVVARARTIAETVARGAAADAWQDFRSRAADYFAMLAELGFLTEDEDVVAGGLPEEIVRAAREFELETRHLTVSLRGYQAFAARFALVQRKVIIGDEMGLGKTVESLAVMAHLAAKGFGHAMVVCPAAVVTNWVREVEERSRLRPHRLHGTGRENALRSWRRQGGVAVTTYESLGWLQPHLASLDELPVVVVDEAHYIKNPSSLRARRTASLVGRADRAVLLTGTPLENRVEEFRNLIRYLRPDLAVDATDLRPRLFRQQVAPAYLRRNQEDVLTELPELVEVEEWLPMSSADKTAYREAVYSGNFHAMRQVCMLQHSQSEKISRLVEIVEEAEENGRRVLVFSHYLNVLDAVVRALPGKVFGPLTGAVPAKMRQQMVDDFSGSDSGAALVAQISAGGVGLNIQAASVVILCEPQLKPTTEWQAIARAQRMGQVLTVQVHRLLSEEGVDLNVRNILSRKKAIFADFAAVSDMAASAPEAYDVSEGELVREVIEAERQRLFTGLPDLEASE